MKLLFFLLSLNLLLAACQPKAAPTALPPIANSSTSGSSKPNATPDKRNSAAGSPTSSAGTPGTATQPAVHRSSADPNAVNLIVIRDQPIINNILIVDSVSSAQAGWVVLYFDSHGKPHVFITYAAVPAGKSSQVRISFNQNLNPSLELGAIPPAPGSLLHAVLQVGTPPPGTPTNENGHIVSVPFIILKAGQ